MLTFKKKKFFFVLLIIVTLIISIFFIVSDIVRYGYDRQSKTVELVKSIIPKHYVGKIKDNIFIISKLKARNEFLDLQVKKYEQGYEGQKYKSEQYNLDDQKFKINYFFTPFKRLDVDLGWKAEKKFVESPLC